MNVSLSESLHKWLKRSQMSGSEDIVAKEAKDGTSGTDGTDGWQPTEANPLTDARRIAHVLKQISKDFFSDEWIESSLKTDVKTDEKSSIDNNIRINNLQSIVEKIVEYYREILGVEELAETVLPNVETLVIDNDNEELGRLLRLVLNCAVSTDDKNLIIRAVVDLNDQHLSSVVMNCLKNSTQTESKNCSEEMIINSNNNLSEEEIINNSNNNVINDTNVENKSNSNSMISCADIKAKESFAQLSDDLRNEFNKNNLFEENLNQKYQFLAERMNNTSVSIVGTVDHNLSSNGGRNEEVVRLHNQIQYIQNENNKLRESEENYLIQIDRLREELNHLRDSGISVWNREAMTGICDREYIYKLIISQLLYDGHQNLAISLSNSEKFKKLVPPSERLHHLIAIALKAEGDSPLSDDSIHPMNLIDLDYEGDRTSGSSRASFYEHSVPFRGRSFSPDNEGIGGLSSRMLDMGRIISKTSQNIEPMHSLTHVQSNDSIASRSTPDISIPAFTQSINNGLRAMTPNGVEMGGQSGVLGTGAQQLDLSDLITQINLAQLVYMNPDPSASVASSSANTPSPTPLTPSVPLENGGLVLNEAALKNISQLAKMSANEVHNGLVQTNSSSPTSLSSTLGRSSSTSGSKPNVMQIRCKFGQLGQQKGQFSSPHGFCLGVDEEIVIADTNNHRICIFDKSADFKHAFGVPGKDEAQLWYPRKVAIIRTAVGGSGNSAPRYVICDRGAERSRMQIFTRSGHFVRKIAIRYIDIVAGLAITPTGHIVAVDSVSPTVFVIAETGDLLRWFDCSEYMREPSDIAISNNEYYICDFKGHCVVVFNDEGQYVRKIGCEGLTSFPNGIDISDAGDILVGDSHGNRFHVVVFDRSGTLVSEFECPYVKVSRCCGLKITSEGYVVTLAKNNHHVLVLNTLYIM